MQDETTELEGVDDTTIKITESEVIGAIKKQKNRKSPGNDELTNALIKYGGQKLANELTKLLQKIMDTKSVPLECKDSILVPIFKKGDRKAPQNYRRIHLLSTTLKLTTRIITEKLKTIITLEDEQQVFRSGRSCNDAIFLIRQIVKKSIEYNKPAFICFVDLKKAFDRVRIERYFKNFERKESFFVPNRSNPRYIQRKHDYN